MFHLFVLVSLLVATEAGPPGTVDDVLTYKPQEFATQAACEDFMKSPEFDAVKASASNFIAERINEEYKDQVVLKFVCSDKTAPELKGD